MDSGSIRCPLGNMASMHRPVRFMQTQKVIHTIPCALSFDLLPYVVYGALEFGVEPSNFVDTPFGFV